jgi:predicted nucleic acid-binding protein
VCLIVDTNLAAVVFAAPPDEDFAPILDWLQKRDGCLVLGGHLSAELLRVEAARRWLIQLKRAGRSREIPREQVEQEEATVLATGLCCSNDSHVIALARVSGARTLCTRDKALHRDFKHPGLLSGPRGSIYQNRHHERLLRHSRSCGRLARRRGR